MASLGASLLPRNERKMLYMICMPAARASRERAARNKRGAGARR